MTKRYLQTFEQALSLDNKRKTNRSIETNRCQLVSSYRLVSVNR